MSETPDFKDRISELLRKLFEIVRYRELMRVSLEKAQAELKDDFTRRDAPLEAEMKRIMTELYGLIMGNRPKLLTGAIKSFAMVYGNVSIPKKATSIKVTDSELLESLARKYRILNKVGIFKRSWSPDVKALSAWLDQNPSLAAQFADAIEHVGGYDEVYARPNDAYLTHFDPNRLSDASIKVEPSQE